MRRSTFKINGIPGEPAETFEETELEACLRDRGEIQIIKVFDDVPPGSAAVPALALSRALGYTRSEQLPLDQHGEGKKLVMRADALVFMARRADLRSWKAEKVAAEKAAKLRSERPSLRLIP